MISSLRIWMSLLRWLCFALALTHYVASQWAAEDMALYDLVEEVNENFYTLFGIEQDAKTAEIKKGYRRLSLEFHPDRSSADNAAEKFRQIVGVYEVLKSPEMREKYDRILENGLPDWRSGVYYYRRARKVSLLEALLILMPIFTGVHYLMLWGTYYEKYLVATQKKSRPKKDKKNQKTAEEEENQRVIEILEEYRPTWSKMLPAICWRATKSLVSLGFHVAQDSMTKGNVVVKVEVEEVTRTVQRPPRQEFEFAMATDVKAVNTHDEALRAEYEKEETTRIAKYTKDSPWTVEDLALLVKLCSDKFPPGTPNRWDLMAEVLQRSATDVTSMAGKIKHMRTDEYSKLLGGQTSSAVSESSQSTMIDSSGNTTSTSSSVKKDVEWSQQEQKDFEIALQKYPKGTDERWDQISNAVGTKSKAQCVERFKILAEMVRQRKTGSAAK